MAEDHGVSISIRKLYKLFGPHAKDHVEDVKRGMSKAELNERFHHVLGLKDISLDIPAGSVQVIMGLSGSGKSTLIRHINRLIEPTTGEILVNGVDVVKMKPLELREFRRHKTAMVFQKFALLPHRTVIENAIFGLEIQGLSHDESVKTAMRWLDRVGLRGFERKYPNQLSGGMQQRVGLARALCNDAPVLLMDEAYSALDPLIRIDMQTVLLDLQKEIRKTIVFITHDLDEALRLGDQIAILRDGQVVQVGSREDIVLRPADDYVESFVKEVNRGRVVRVDAVMRRDARETARSQNAARVHAGVTVEAAVRAVAAAGASEALVVDDADEVIGVASLLELSAAMVAREGGVHARPAMGAPAQSANEAAPS